MRYEDLKKDLVEDRKVLNSKQLATMVLRLLLALLGFDMIIATLVMRTIGFQYSIIIFIGSVFLFSSLVEYITETDRGLKIGRRISYFWFIFYILFVGELILFQMLGI